MTATNPKINHIENDDDNLLYAIPYDVLPELRKDPPRFLMETIAFHGPVVPLKLGSERVILASHPDAVEQVCRSKASNYVKTKFVDKLKPIMGEGIATVNGAEWVKSRAVIQPMLKQSQVNTLVREMDAVVSAAVQGWDDPATELGEASMSLALQVISRTMFGDDQGDHAKRLVKAQHIVQEYISDSIWDADEPGTLRHREYEKALDTVKQLMSDIITERRQGQPKNDLLQALLRAADTDTGKSYSDQQVFDEVMTIFIAGHETSGATLAWFWQLAALRPDLQTKMRQEILQHIPLDETATLQQISKLTFTTAVLKETMRLWPSAWWFARTAVEDDIIMGVAVRAGDSIIISEYATQRMPGIWDNPDTFDESRFLGKPLPHRFAYLPFGAGPRTCPGSHFAMAEMLLTIARTLTRYELSATKQANYEALFTLRTAGAVPVHIKPYVETIFVKSPQPAEHALIKSMLKIRKAVFVDQLKWNLQVTDDGCEVDQFDTPDTSYGVTLAKGQITSFSRQLPTAKPTLLYNVFNYLIDKPSAKTPPLEAWEGSRFACNPDMDARQSAIWVRRYLNDLMAEARTQGINQIYTVSNPTMERVLKRAGMHVARLGEVKRDPHGEIVLGLVLSTVLPGGKLGHLRRAERNNDPAPE